LSNIYIPKEETNQWFNHHNHKLPQLTTNERQIVEYLTGRIPLLLRCLFDIQHFDESKFMNFPDLIKVNDDISKFFRTRKSHNKDNETL